MLYFIEKGSISMKFDTFKKLYKKFSDIEINTNFLYGPDMYVKIERCTDINGNFNALRLDSQYHPGLTYIPDNTYVVEVPWEELEEVE